MTNELVEAINQYGFPIIAAMGLGYFELISPLIKAVQELSAKVAKLEAA